MEMAEVLGWLVRAGLIAVIVALFRQVRAEARTGERQPFGFPFPPNDAISRS